MGAKTKSGARTSGAGTRRKVSALERAREARLRGHHSAWAKRHPEQAAELRALRKQRAEALQGYSDKLEGTAETHAHAARVRQGALTRMYHAGGLTIEQLGAALEIREVHARIGAGLGVRTVSLETRIDHGRQGGDAFWESLGRVRAEVAYSAWRAAVDGIWPVLAMIVDEQGLARTARRYGMRNAGLKQLLCAALDLWPAMHRQARDEVDEATLLAAQAGLL